jgi:hypothetical protein
MIEEIPKMANDRASCSIGLMEKSDEGWSSLQKSDGLRQELDSIAIHHSWSCIPSTNEGGGL